MLHHTEYGVDPYDYHELRYGESAFTERRLEEVHLFHRSVNEDIWRSQSDLEGLTFENEVVGESELE